MIEIYCDGSCLSNATPDEREAGIGCVVVEDGETVDTLSEYVGSGPDVTNNVAEYMAVLGALQWRADHRADEPCTIHTDSRLVVHQVHGRWNCNADHLEVVMHSVRDELRDADDLIESEETRYLDRAHDLAQHGALRTDPDEPSSKPRSSTESSSSTPTHIEPEILDEVPGPFEQPHDGIEPSNIPRELRSRVQWINWAPEYVDGRETKIPRQPENTGWRASSTDPDTWADLETALNAISESTPGLGFVLATGDPYVVIDFDHCRDRETYVIDDWVMDVVEDLNSYSHVSTSNTGVHTIVKADGVPDGWTNKSDGYDREMEVYEWGRFIAFTGHHLETTPQDIRRVDDFGEFLLDLEDELW